jgi:hypothetical protein
MTATQVTTLVHSYSCTNNITLNSVSLYSETNLIHFLFSLLRIKGLYVFRALLAHPQEALHKRHLVYCVRVMSVGYTRIGVFHSNPGAANRPGLEWRIGVFHWSVPLECSTGVFHWSVPLQSWCSNRHNTHAIYQVSYV